MFFVTIISCLLPFISGKLLKNPKNIKDFEILEVCFPAKWRLKFLNFLRQAQPRCAYLVGEDGEGEGRGGEGNGGEGEGRGEKEGRGEGMGCFYLGPPTSKCVATALFSVLHRMRTDVQYQIIQYVSFCLCFSDYFNFCLCFLQTPREIEHL